MAGLIKEAEEQPPEHGWVCVEQTGQREGERRRGGEH